MCRGVCRRPWLWGRRRLWSTVSVLQQQGADALHSRVPGRTSRPGLFGCHSRARKRPRRVFRAFRALREARRSRCAAKRRAPRLSGWGACQTVLEIVANRSARELAWLYFLMMPAISSGRR